MPCFLRKAQTVARGAGDRIANAARGQHSAVAGDHPLALRVAHAHARYAAFLNHQPQRFYLQLERLAAQRVQKRARYVAGVIADRKDAVAALHLGLASQLVHQPLQIVGRKKFER